MRGFLVRVGIDSSDDGRWNGPIEEATGRFTYVPIAETKPLRPGFDRFYNELEPELEAVNCSLPARLHGCKMHLDPDFESLT